MKASTILLAILMLSTSATGFSVFDPSGEAAVIQLSGTIKPSSRGFSSNALTPDEVRDLTSRALNSNPEAVIYEINSGGGAVVASKEVMRSIDSVEKPTVCRIRDIGASGAYLSSLGCDRIVADRASLTGSIGVKASYLEFSGLLEKMGVEYVNLTAGERKDAGSRYKNITEEERELLQQKIDRIHTQFVNVVERRRNLSKSRVEQVRKGEAFLGARAKELGLVDSLGGRKVALEEAENLTGKELRATEIEASTGFSLLSLLQSSMGLELFSSKAPFSSSYR